MASVCVFKITAWVIGRTVPDGIPRIIDRIESVVLVTIFSMLAIQLLVITAQQTWKKIKSSSDAETME